MTTTSRLRELEEQHRTTLKNDVPIVRLSSKSYIEGYKKALEDLRPVLEAAKNVIASWAAENIEGVDKGRTGDSDLRALKDALAEATDGQN